MDEIHAQNRIFPERSVAVLDGCKAKVATRYCGTQFYNICDVRTADVYSFGQPDCCRGNYNDLRIPPADADGSAAPAWNIAPNNAESREVIWNYPWTTDYIALADGTKWYTKGAWSPASDAYRFQYPKSGSAPPANVMSSPSTVPMECVGDTECLGARDRRSSAAAKGRLPGDGGNN